MPPTSAAHGLPPNSDRGLGLGVLLGTDYERRKQRLQQELQQDYKHYIATRKNTKPPEPAPNPQNLSLVFDERITVKEKLRDERNKEYNLFLHEQAQNQWSKGGKPITYKAMCSSSSAPPPAFLSHHNSNTQTQSPQNRRPASRRDAATLTEAADYRKIRRTRGHQGHLRRGDRLVYRPEELFSSEEELDTDTEEKLEFRRRRWQDRHTPEPRYKEKGSGDRRADRDGQYMKEAEAPSVQGLNNPDKTRWADSPQDANRMRMAAIAATSKDEVVFTTGLLIGAIEEQTVSHKRKEQYKQELLKQIATEHRNKMREKELGLTVAATGAIDPEKEPDRINLFGALNQNYESWRWDVPKAGMEVGAIGKYQSPSFQADKPLENPRNSPGRSQVVFPSPSSENSAALIAGKTMTGGAQDPLTFSADNQSNVSRMVGEVAMTRVAGVPQLKPPVFSATNKTPYDEAYFYYGSRNPLDPHLIYNQNVLHGTFQSPSQQPSSLKTGQHRGVSNHHTATSLAVGELAHLADMAKQRKEMAVSYQEELRQQIKERREFKRREKEEKVCYDAKIKQEMMVYNPWGRSGGGAPIKDQQGNLLSDLNQMHRINEESYRNPVTSNVRQTQSYVTKDGPSYYSKQIIGISDTPNLQKRHLQDSYKEALKQQIEENRRKQAEERERIRIEEEKEERRLAEQRVRMQREYEEEQRKQKWIEHRLENQSWIQEDKTHRIEEKKRLEENRQKQAQERERLRIQEEKEEKRLAEQRLRMQQEYEEEQRQQKKIRHPQQGQSRSSEVKTPCQERMERVLKKQDVRRKLAEKGRATEESQTLTENEKAPSSAIPTLQRRSRNTLTSDLSQGSSRTEHSVSSPPSCAAPKVTHRPQESQQEVIGKLSDALRMFLRKEQRKLVAQLGQQEQQLTHSATPSRPMRKSQGEVFQSDNKHAVEALDRGPYPAAADVHMQNIREFNHLKYRDPASCEESAHTFPDPTTGSRSLEIQQQALLRQQKRKLRLMKREGEQDCLDQQSINHPPSGHQSNTPAYNVHRRSVLPSETMFIDVYSGEPSAEAADQQESPQPGQDEAVSLDDDDQPSKCLHLRASPGGDSGHMIRSQWPLARCDTCTGDSKCRSGVMYATVPTEGQSDDEVDDTSLHSALERCVSAETVATEAWLRPGTSDAAKCCSCREEPRSGRDAPPWKTHCVT